MKEFESNFENVSIELKRGLTNLVVFSQCKEPTYGYELVKLLDEKNFPLDANTVYPCCVGWKTRLTSLGLGCHHR